MVMLATSVTATARMLPVLPNTSVAGANMTSLLAVLAETCAAASVLSVTRWSKRSSVACMASKPGSSQHDGGQVAVTAAAIKTKSLQSSCAERLD
jgi:hypothetical protein